MKRIGIFLNTASSVGGTFQYSRSILDALASLPAAEYHIIAAYTDPAWSSYLGRYRFSQVHLDVGFFWNRIGVIIAFLRLPLPVWRRYSCRLSTAIKRMLDEECDLWIFPGQDALSYLAPVNAVTAIHDLMHRYRREFQEAGNSREYRWREWHYSMICRYSRTVLVDSVTGGDMVVESYCTPREKLAILPFAPPSYLFVNDDTTDRLSQVPEKYFFYPAQFWCHKNHIRLFHAIAELKKEYPEVRLVCVGYPKNGYNDALRVRSILDLENEVLVLGYVSDQVMRQLYKGARAMIFPSFFGPTNIPPLEAMAMGCPMAISNVYAMPEQAGEAALYFDPASVSEMTATLRLLWSDDALCQHLAAEGTKRSCEWRQSHFSKRLKQIIDNSLKSGN